jgi:hypothetical protein
MQNEGQEDWRSGLVLKETRYNNEIFERSVFFWSSCISHFSGFSSASGGGSIGPANLPRTPTRQGEVNCGPQARCRE